ncbi:MAG: UDP-N-acetylmuramoyl-L-alanyl-D-glutamate--2,6-diaminopimelate ligase [Polyangiaceae bacterium]
MSLGLTPQAGLRHPEGSTLAELARALGRFAPRLEGDANTRVTGVQQDSRAVRAGDLFVARGGQRVDGARFIGDAAARGASAVLLDAGKSSPSPALPALFVDDLPRALAFAAEHTYGEPSRNLGLVGITGTNGKTTTAFLVEQALLELGKKPARLGTLGFSFAGALEDSALTTPEADAISRYLAQVVGRGGTHAVMEVSSVALELARVAALQFEVAAFSNLTQDHLDFHGSMQAYGAAKARLFHELAPRVSVINVDDAFGRELAASVPGRVIRVSQRGATDVRVLESELGVHGIRAAVELGGQRFELSSRLVGAHNLDNLLLALGIVWALGAEPGEAVAALSGGVGVPGRLERCDQPGDELLVVVDYAHTPDALERALSALRPLTRGRLLCVFGCGGDRDPGKRPLMGEVVARAADFAVVTNDNPRTESPEQIAAAIVPPLERLGTAHRVLLDRAQAIQFALDEAAPGDSVLIAGKGHEDYQIFGSEKRPFDDREQAKLALAARRGREGR